MLAKTAGAAKITSRDGDSMNLQQRIAALASDLGIEPSIGVREDPSRELEDLAAGCGLKLVCIDEKPKRDKTELQAVYTLDVSDEIAQFRVGDEDFRFSMYHRPMHVITDMFQRANGCVVLKLSNDSQVVIPKHRIVALRYVPVE
jgi:hypothetical protein